MQEYIVGVTVESTHIALNEIVISIVVSIQGVESKEIKLYYYGDNSTLVYTFQHLKRGREPYKFSLTIVLGNFLSVQVPKKYFHLVSRNRDFILRGDIVVHSATNYMGG